VFDTNLSVEKELWISSDLRLGIAGFGQCDNTIIKSKIYYDFTRFFFQEFTQKSTMYGVAFSATSHQQKFKPDFKSQVLLYYIRSF